MNTAIDDWKNRFGKVSGENIELWDKLREVKHKN